MQQPDQGSVGDAGANAQPEINNIVQPAPMPIQPEANIPGPAEQAAPPNDNDQIQENVGGEQQPPIIVPREELDQEPVQAHVGIDMVEVVLGDAPDPDMPVIEVPVEDPIERPRAATPVQQSEAAGDVLKGPIEEETSSSMTSSTTSSTGTSTTETSDEDNMPLVSLYNSARGPRMPNMNCPGRYPSGLRPVANHRLVSMEMPGRPRIIPRAARPQLPDGDDDSSSSDKTPSKRRRLYRRRH